MSKIRSSKNKTPPARARRKPAKAKAAKRARNTRNAAQTTAAPARKPFYPRVFAANWFSFHKYCAEPACRRAQSCAGGADPPCFYAFWRHVPERYKIVFRETIHARGKGLSVVEAMAAGEAEAVRYEELMAKLDAQDAARNGAAERNPAPDNSNPAHDNNVHLVRTVPAPAARVRQL